MREVLIFSLLACCAYGYQVIPRFSHEKGLYLGELKKDDVGLSSKVYALSSTLLLLSDFHLDPDARGLFIFAGTLNDDGSYTKVGYPLKLINGKIRPLHLIAKDLSMKDNEGSKSMIVLKFPDKDTIFNVDWIAIISRKQRDVYSRILLDEELLLNIPQSKLLPGLVKDSKVISPHLLYSDQRTIEILDFNFSPSDEETIFRAILSQGSKKDDEMLICSQPIQALSNTTLTLKLPDGTQAFRLKALELYSLKTKQSVTYSIFPQSLNLSVLPPSLIQLGLLSDEKLDNEIVFTDDCDASLASLEKVEVTTVRATTRSSSNIGTRKRILPQFEHFPNSKQRTVECDSDCQKEKSIKDNPSKIFRNKNVRGALKNRRLSSIKKVPRNRTGIELMSKHKVTAAEKVIINDEEDLRPIADSDGYSGEEFIPNRQYQRFHRQKLPLLRRTQSPREENIQRMDNEFINRLTTDNPSRIFRTANISQFSPQLGPRYSLKQQAHRPQEFQGSRRPLRRRRPPTIPENPTIQDSPIGFRIRNRDIHQYTETPETFPSAPPPSGRVRDILSPRSDIPTNYEVEPNARSENPLHNFFSFISKPRHWFQGQRPKVGQGSNRLEDSLLNLKRNRDTIAYLNMQERSKNRQQQIQRHGGLSFRKRFLTPFPHEQESKRPGRPMVRLSSRRNESPPMFRPPSESELYGREGLEANLSVIPHELLSKSVISPKYYESPLSERKFDPLKINSESGFKPIVKGPGNQPILAFNVMDRIGSPILQNLTKSNEEFKATEEVSTPIPHDEYMNQGYTPYDQGYTPYDQGNTFIYPYSENTTPIPESTSHMPSTRFPQRRKTIGIRHLPRYRVEKFNSADFNSFTQLPRVDSISSRNEDYYTPYNERDRIDDPNQPLLYYR